MHTRFQAPNLNALWTQLFVEEALRHGLDYFCVSPGSRSTPLTVAIARHPDARMQLFYDERAAAFHALGYARATGKTAILVCTSGTAVANYFPAVIEASVDHVPMIVCSADRPPELEQSGANQTIPQTHIFGQHVRWFFEMPCPTSAVPPNFVLTTLAQALHRATGPFAGPVHLNWRFREPLAPSPEAISETYTAPITRWFEGKQPWTHHIHASSESEPALSSELIHQIATSSKGILALGRMPLWWDKRPLLQLAERLGWPIFADIGSGLRLGPAPTQRILSFDILLREKALSTEMSPDMVLHLGGPLLSKRFPSYLQEHLQAPYILVQDHPERIDPTHQVHQRLSCHPCAFAKALLQHLPQASQTTGNPWFAQWKALDDTQQAQLQSSLAQAPLHEPAIAHDISTLLPKEHVLFVGNSMPIRDLDLFASTGGSAVPIAANRGASGIDGLLATALGVVAGSQKQGTLLIGDLSLIHDLNSLILLQQSQLPLVVLVINNHGGGIFQFLPIAQFEDVFQRCFTTPHSLSLAPIARAIGLSAVQVTTREELRQAYKSALSNQTPSVIEVLTQKEDSLAFHRTLRPSKT
ncbi:MAG: 2-succinyl-5-enolpyruvyl-6-hydroxy-3-cyclohexene-1-carboxylic-acid synthase [Myxococcales bacterium]|nr:2-succinyl-5-enolpyruvyl-6-hydroxy-3-cyclohexene-1-carboxylic-acid synthase [Myxococcales bacterium]